MTVQVNVQDRTQLERWIDKLSPPQFNIIYDFVKDLIENEQDETEYLLSSNKMRERILAARASDQGIPIEVVREKLGI